MRVPRLACLIRVARLACLIRVSRRSCLIRVSRLACLIHLFLFLCFSLVLGVCADTTSHRSGNCVSVKCLYVMFSEWRFIVL